MIAEPGIYRVDVHPASNPTYLQGGIYRVFVRETPKQIKERKQSSRVSSQALVNFRAAKGTNFPSDDDRVNWAGQPGTVETVNMLKGFEKQARVVCTQVNQRLLDSLAWSLFAVEDFSDLTDAQQIEACLSGFTK